MTRRKPRRLRADTYAVLRRAVEEGIAHGWRRAHKHADAEPAEDERERVCEAIEGAVLSEICEWFKFDEEDK